MDWKNYKIPKISNNLQNKDDNNNIDNNVVNNDSSAPSRILLTESNTIFAFDNEIDKRLSVVEEHIRDVHLNQSMRKRKKRRTLYSSDNTTFYDNSSNYQYDEYESVFIELEEETINRKSKSSNYDDYDIDFDELLPKRKKSKSDSKKMKAEEIEISLEKPPPRQVNVLRHIKSIKNFQSFHTNNKNIEILSGMIYLPQRIHTDGNCFCLTAYKSISLGILRVLLNNHPELNREKIKKIMNCINGLYFE